MGKWRSESADVLELRDGVVNVGLEPRRPNLKQQRLNPHPGVML